MTAEFYPKLNDRARLFYLTTNYWHYLNRVGVWRMLWRQDIERVILHGPQQPFLLNEFSKGTTIAIMDGIGVPSVFNAKDVTTLFLNCQIRNRWIPHRVIMRSELLAMIEVFLEVNCDIVTAQAEVTEWLEERGWLDGQKE